MPHLRTKFGELVQVAVPVVTGVLLWSYLAVAMVYGTLSAQFTSKFTFAPHPSPSRDRRPPRAIPFQTEPVGSI